MLLNYEALDHEDFFKDFFEQIFSAHDNSENKDKRYAECDAAAGDAGNSHTVFHSNRSCFGKTDTAENYTDDGKGNRSKPETEYKE